LTQRSNPGRWVFCGSPFKWLEGVLSVEQIFSERELEMKPMSKRWSIAGSLLFVLLLVLDAMPLLAWEKEPLDVYHGRRVSLMDRVKNGVIVVFGNKEGEMADPDLAVFRQEDDFYYLTGWNEPGAILMLLPKGRQNIATAMFPSEQVNREILFLPTRNVSRERWTGLKLGPDDRQAATVTGFSLVLPVDRFPGEMTNALSTTQMIYTMFPLAGIGFPPSHEKEKLDQLRILAPFAEVRDIREIVNGQRQVKNPSEIALIQKAVDASVDAHLAAAKAIKPGAFEYQVAALLKYTWENKGCEGAAYAPIVGAGINSTVLHYNQSAGQMKDGDTVVVDAAAEYSGYAADITRTFPVSGKFTQRQRQIYELVLGAQKAVADSIVPGKTLIRSLTQVARDYFMNSPLRGPKGQDDTMDHYFIHGVSHWIGLNVHDVGDFNQPLGKNMVFTIEPGIYIPEEKLGIRIEDDYLCNDEGKVVKLSARLPGSWAEIERLMAAGDATKTK
jgi:Xaa-Pro aminopeptidase